MYTYMCLIIVVRIHIYVYVCVFVYLYVRMGYYSTSCYTGRYHTGSAYAMLCVFVLY